MASHRPSRIWLAAVASLSAAAAAQDAPVTPRNIEIVLDCSGSMESTTTRFTSFQNKVDIAKGELVRFVQGLPEANTRVALRVFGTVREAGCQDSRLLHPLKLVDKAHLASLIEPLKPAYHGKTPIALSLDRALEDFQAAGAAEAQNSIILITDGVESCGGNVNAAIDRIKSAGINLKVNIVGFDVLDSADAQTATTLKEMAESTGGKAEFPKTQAELEKSLTALAPPAKPPAVVEEAPAPGKTLVAWLRQNLVVVVVGGVVLLSAGTLLLLRGRRGAEDDEE